MAKFYIIPMLENEIRIKSMLRKSKVKLQWLPGQVGALPVFKSKEKAIIACQRYGLDVEMIETFHTNGHEHSR